LDGPVVYLQGLEALLRGKGDLIVEILLRRPGIPDVGPWDQGAQGEKVFEDPIIHGLIEGEGQAAVYS
jgi:hypothetical protein